MDWDYVVLITAFAGLAAVIILVFIEIFMDKWNARMFKDDVTHRPAQECKDVLEKE